MAGSWALGFRGTGAPERLGWRRSRIHGPPRPLALNFRLELPALITSSLPASMAADRAWTGAALGVDVADWGVPRDGTAFWWG